MLHENMKNACRNLLEAHDFTYIGSLEIDITGNRVYLSEEAYHIFGIPLEQYDGTYEGYIHLIHPEDQKNVDQRIKEAAGDSAFSIEYRIIRPNGSVRCLRQLVKPIYDKKGERMYFYGAIQDKTEMIEFRNIIDLAEETIEHIQTRFKILTQQSNDVFEIISTDLMIQYINPTIEKVIGYAPEEWIGKCSLEFIKEEQRQKFIKLVDFVLEHPDQSVTGDFILKNREGKESFQVITISNHLEESSIQGIVVNWRDITDRVQNQKEIEYLATHDELTGLPNRVYFKKKLTELCEKHDKDYDFALIMLDIDGFRYINDALGHQMGDQLILQVASRLKEFLGEAGFLCRYSGDQFVIIIPNLHSVEMYGHAVKMIMTLFNEAYKVDLYELDMTVSLGISMFPNDERDPDLLINYANISLLRSKNEGKNRYKFYSSEIGIQIYKQVALRNDLLKAIEKNQFHVYYQAQVHLESNNIIAAEALIRWMHPEWGLVSPNEFISLAEEMGFIINLGNWVLREVCRNYKNWMEQGIAPIKVSVNYSSVQFFERNFVENIINIITEYGLAPDFLIMEITESVFMKNMKKAVVDIKRLQAFGIQVALDDFGTGFSSLSYLSSFNIDILKIDQSFIKNVLLDETSSIITRTVIDLARELKIKLVAEGIENQEQLTYLRSLNCYSGQGYLYNKPMPVEEFAQILLREKCIPAEQPGENKKREEKRKYLRINLAEVLEADAAILGTPGQKFKIGKIKVKIKNISSRGLCLTAGVRLPVNKDFVMQFRISLPGYKETRICGYPVWVEELDENFYEYGVEFDYRAEEAENIAGVIYALGKYMNGIQ